MLLPLHLPSACAVDLVDDVVVIFGPSEASDVPLALREASARLGGLGRRPVIFRDAARAYAAVARSGAAFRGLLPLGEDVLEPAVSAAKRATGLR